MVPPPDGAAAVHSPPRRHIPRLPWVITGDAVLEQPVKAATPDQSARSPIYYYEM